MKDFDKFKDLENFEVPYNPDHWLDMKKRLQKQLFLKKIKAFSAVAAALVVATGLAWYFIDSNTFSQISPSDLTIHDTTNREKTLPQNTKNMTPEVSHEENSVWNGTKKIQYSDTKVVTEQNAAISRKSPKKIQYSDSKVVREKNAVSPKKIVKKTENNLDKKTAQENTPSYQKLENLKQTNTTKTLDQAIQTSTDAVLENSKQNSFEGLALLSLSPKDLVFAPKTEKISPTKAFLPQMQPKDAHKAWVLSLHGQMAALLKQEGKSFGGGIQLDYVVNKKLSLTTGFHAQFMNYESENSLKKIEDDDDDNLFLPNFFPKNFYETAREIKTEARIVDWQVGLKYNFAEKFYVKTDIINSFFLRGEQSQKFREKDISFANYMSFFEKKRVFLTHFYPLSGVDVAVGYEQKIKKVGLRIEPFVKIYRQNIGEMPLSKSQNMLGLRLSLVFAGI